MIPRLAEKVKAETYAPFAAIGHTPMGGCAIYATSSTKTLGFAEGSIEGTLRMSSVTNVVSGWGPTGVDTRNVNDGIHGD